jgi:hypothetical protein
MVGWVALVSCCIMLIVEVLLIFSVRIAKIKGSPLYVGKLVKNNTPIDLSCNEYSTNLSSIILDLY